MRDLTGMKKRRQERFFFFGREKVKKIEGKMWKGVFPLVPVQLLFSTTLCPFVNVCVCGYYANAWENVYQ